MGFITTVTVNNDLMHEIGRAARTCEDSKAFCTEFHEALMRISYDKPAYVRRAGITVVEHHHADYAQPVLVGGKGEAQVVGMVSINYQMENPELELLKQLADKHGFILHTKRKRIT